MYNKEYYENNKEKMIEYMRNHQKKNADRIKAYRREYYKKYYHKKKMERNGE